MRLGASRLTPANGRFLLDTNILIALLNDEEAIRSNLVHPREVSISVVALGELFFGAAKSVKRIENIARIERFVSGRSIIVCDIEIAKEYGSIKKLLKEKGRPIPENDLWIAATAKYKGMILVTRDHHFDEVDGLTTTDWK